MNLKFIKQRMNRVYKSKLFKRASVEWEVETTKIPNVENIKILLSTINQVQGVQGVQGVQEEEYDPEHNWSVVSRKLRSRIDEFIDKCDPLNLSVNYVLKKMKQKNLTPVINYIKYKIRQRLI